MSNRMRCPVCGDVIGVYEPLLVVGRGSVRRSSLAGEPQLSTAEGMVMHFACGSDVAVAGDAAASPVESRNSEF